MRYRLTIAVASALMLSLHPALSQECSSLRREALSLYESGMYSRARTLFEQAGDPLSEGYALLCSALESDPSFPDRAAEYLERNPSGILAPQLHFRSALVLFDKGQYLYAGRELDLVDPDCLDKTQRSQFEFDRAYCHYSLEEYDKASARFLKVTGMPYSEYTAPAYYFLGYMAYVGGSFDSALRYLSESASDPRFEQMSAFYIVECKFMQKDYSAVVEEGTRIFDDAPAARQSRLARIISESCMVLGDKEGALKFLNLESSSDSPRSRSDYFHAGSVLFGAGDWQGAVDNFTAMGERSDSLGQIASYQMGYSFVRIGNKVAALDAFNDAAKYGWNSSIQEDAAFNYAKLAFDLNHDDTGFKAYLARFSTASKGERIYDYMALAALFNRDYKAAIESYDNIEALNDTQKGNYIKANYLRAVQLMQSGAWSDAIPCLRASLFHYPRTDPFNQMARYSLAEACFRTGNQEEALRLFTDLYNTSALDGKTEGELLSYDIAYCHYLQNNPAQASRWFDIYLRSGGRTARRDALVRRADCDFLRRNYTDAVSSYALVTGEYPEADFLYPVYRQGLSYGLAGDKKSKVKALSRVMSASPQADFWDETMYEYGRACMDVSDNKTAISAFSALREKSSDSTYVARALIGLGMVWRNNSDYDKALASYKSVVSMMPGSEFAQDALLAIESIYQARKEPQMYLEYLETSKLNADKTPEEKELMYFNTSEQVFLSGNYENAVKLLEKYLSDYPDALKKGEATFYLAECCKALDRKEEACALYALVPDLLPDNSFAETSRLNAALINYSLERFAEAYQAYSALLLSARMESNKEIAKVGKMRSAFRARDFEAALESCAAVQGRESDYIKAKSLLSLSRREEAMSVFRSLAASPSTSEGAEASFILAQDALDRADHEAVEKIVYDFARDCGSQSYWLARTYLVLGDSFAARGNLVQARATYESIRDGYSPASAEDDVQDNVKLRLERLQSQN